MIYLKVMAIVGAWIAMLLFALLMIAILKSEKRLNQERERDFREIKNGPKY